MGGARVLRRGRGLQQNNVPSLDNSTLFCCYGLWYYENMNLSSSGGFTLCVAGDGFWILGYLKMLTWEIYRLLPECNIDNKILLNVIERVNSIFYDNSQRND